MKYPQLIGITGRDRHTASATYMGTEPGVVETNRFERGPVDVPRILQFFQPWRCP